MAPKSHGRTALPRSVSSLLADSDRALTRGASDRAAEYFGRAVEELVAARQYDTAIDLTVARREYAMAAEIAERKRDWNRAAQLWFRAGEFARSARARLRNREPMLAAELFERCGLYRRAMEIYEQNGDFVRASQLCERSGDKRRAADFLVRSISGERRLTGAEMVEACRKAGVLYADVGLLELAVRVLRYGKQEVFAGQLLARAGLIEQAISMLVDGGDLLSAAEVAKSGGLEARAQQIYALRAEREGRFREAAAHWVQAGAHAHAARCFEYAGDKENAARANERGGQLALAAEQYEHAGLFEDAARCLRDAGLEADLDSLLHRTGQRDDSILRGIKGGAFFEAASAMVARARSLDPEWYREAVDLLQEIPLSHPDYVAAQNLLAEVKAEQGDTQGAIEMLGRLLGGVAFQSEHVPALYQYGRLLELQGFLAHARSAYQAAFSLDSQYRDIQTRLETLNVPEPTKALSSLSIGGAPLDPYPYPHDRSRSLADADPDQDVGALFAESLADFEDRSPLPELVGEDWSGSNARVGASASPSPSGNSGPSDSSSIQVKEAGTLDIASLIDEELRGLGGEALDRPNEFDVLAALQASETYRPDALAGVVLRGRFRIEKKIGRGGQALVYLARDQVLDRPVAIKVLNEHVAEDAGALERFLREARMAARVHHQSCLAIFDFGQENGLTFMAMEYFRGKTLREVLRRNRLSIKTALRIGRDVATALGAVHAMRIVHRDVKPANILLDKHASVRLTDFGVAAMSDEEPADDGLMMGTMRYMAPEQARGGIVDHRADLFSLGAVIHEMLSGTPPFGGTLDALIARVDKPPPRLPPDIAVPELVQVVLTRCMAPCVEGRYRSASAVVQDLQAGIRSAALRAKRSGGSDTVVHTGDIEITASQDISRDLGPGSELGEFDDHESAVDFGAEDSDYSERSEQPAPARSSRSDRPESEAESVEWYEMDWPKRPESSELSERSENTESAEIIESHDSADDA
ncbi:MAG: protein kinase [Deltaproteobacteria bacterium]|nr:protein kinase [Deltaproteobacteria bacterium]